MTILRPLGQQLFAFATPFAQDARQQDQADEKHHNSHQPYIERGIGSRGEAFHRLQVTEHVVFVPKDHGRAIG